MAATRILTDSGSSSRADDAMNRQLICKTTLLAMNPSSGPDLWLSANSSNNERYSALSVTVEYMLIKHIAFAGAMATVVLGSISVVPRAAADDSICAAAGGYCGFYSPSRNISCEVNVGRGTGIPDDAYCQTVEPPQSAQMDTAGAVKPCTGVSCLGNPPPGIPTLAYGQAMPWGPFNCLSEEDGVTCTVAGGRGFTISRSGVNATG